MTQTGNAEETRTRPPSLDAVRHIRVPQRTVDEVHEWLRVAGQQGCEGVGFWAGVQDGDRFEVKSAYIPRQLAGTMGEGTMVVVSGEELFRMNVWLHRHRLTLVAQIHSHPGDAYHSDTDDDFAVMSRVGGLSIVVPDYARDPFTLATSAVYRLRPDGVWAPVNRLEVGELISIAL
jgi:hypothetical protein